MGMIDLLNACSLDRWSGQGMSARLLIIIVIVYSGRGVALSRLATAATELVTAARDVVQAVLECLLRPA